MHAIAPALDAPEANDPVPSHSFPVPFLCSSFTFPFYFLCSLYFFSLFTCCLYYTLLLFCYFLFSPFLSSALSSLVLSPILFSSLLPFSCRPLLQVTSSDTSTFSQVFEKCFSPFLFNHLIKIFLKINVFLKMNPFIVPQIFSKAVVAISSDSAQKFTIF